MMALVPSVGFLSLPNQNESYVDSGSYLYVLLVFYLVSLGDFVAFSPVARILFTII